MDYLWSNFVSSPERSDDSQEAHSPFTDAFLTPINNVRRPKARRAVQSDDEEKEKRPKYVTPKRSSKPKLSNVKRPKAIKTLVIEESEDEFEVKPTVKPKGKTWTAKNKRDLEVTFNFFN